MDIGASSRSSAIFIGGNEEELGPAASINHLVKAIYVIRVRCSAEIE